ncbi:hypothetical protein D3C74_401990 [compost metagenome]
MEDAVGGPVQERVAQRPGAYGAPQQLPALVDGVEGHPVLAQCEMEGLLGSGEVGQDEHGSPGSWWGGGKGCAAVGSPLGKAGVQVGPRGGAGFERTGCHCAADGVLVDGDA